MTPEIQKMSDELWEAKMARARQEMLARREADLEADAKEMDADFARALARLDEPARLYVLGQ